MSDDFPAHRASYAELVWGIVCKVIAQVNCYAGIYAIVYIYIMKSLLNVYSNSYGLLYTKPREFVNLGKLPLC